MTIVIFATCCEEQEVRIPSAGRKGEPRNHGELKDDTNSAREDKQVCFTSGTLVKYRVVDISTCFVSLPILIKLVIIRN